MKTIQNVRDLKQHGIIPLTMESDAHMFRVLCDVTKQGKAIIERTLDVQLTLHDNWNTASEGNPHIGSLLLPPEFVPSIAVFCLLSHPQIAEAWLLKDGTVIGLGVEDVDRKPILRVHHDGNIRKVFYARPEDRNVHQFTGRTR